MSSAEVAADPKASRHVAVGWDEFARIDGAVDKALIDRIVSSIHGFREQLAATAIEADRSYQLPLANIEWLAEAGLLDMLISVERGGLGADALGGQNPLPFVISMEELARIDMSTAHCFQVHNHAANFLELVCTPEQADRYLTGGVPRYASEDSRIRNLFAWVGAEPGSTADPGRSNTTATRVTGGFVVTGVKQYATNATAATWILLTARPVGTDHSPAAQAQMMMVPARSPGVEIDDSWWRPTGMRACVSPRVTLHEVFVPDEDVIGGEHYSGQSGAGVRVHLGFAANYLGAAQSILDFVNGYIPQRKTHRDPHTQRALGEIGVAVTSARLMLYNAALAWRTLDPRTAGRLSLAAKYQALAIAESVADTAVRASGSLALFEDHPLEKVLRDLRVHSLHAHMDSTAQMLGMETLGFVIDPATQQFVSPAPAPRPEEAKPQ
jgi:alkylation response protein AidB-like acyl-CoA dehydrogenase